jgi:3-hydroxyisobutyrate dehydrogenase
MQRVALMGLGIMGTGMASRLLQAGLPLVVYNRHAERAKAAVAAGARLAASPRDAAADADVVISVVADDLASRAVWLGESGALASAKRGAVLIESGTLSSGWIRELAREVAKQGCELLDAPVTGTKPEAESGQLRFLVGGSSEALEKARPVLSHMSREILYVGPSGSGCLLKLINNFMCGVEVASFAQAIVLAERAGLDPGKVTELLLNGASTSLAIKSIASRAKPGGSFMFALELMKKDLTYAAAAGEPYQMTLRTAEAARELLQEAVDQGLGTRDASAIVEFVRAKRMG